MNLYKDFFREFTKITEFLVLAEDQNPKNVFVLPYEKMFHQSRSSILEPSAQ